MASAGVLKILSGTLYKVYDCLTTKFYTQNQYKIKLGGKKLAMLKRGEYLKKSIYASPD